MVKKFIPLADASKLPILNNMLDRHNVYVTNVVRRIIHDYNVKNPDNTIDCDPQKFSMPALIVKALRDNDVNNIYAKTSKNNTRPKVSKNDSDRDIMLRKEEADILKEIFSGDENIG